MRQAHRAPAGTDTESDEHVGLALLLKQAEHAIHARMRPALEQAGLVPEQWQVMAVLLVRPGLRMTELADAAVLPAASLTRHVDKLVERALVVRRIDPGDKRRVVAALSPMGARLARSLRRVERSIEVTLREGPAGERLEALARLLG